MQRNSDMDRIDGRIIAVTYLSRQIGDTLSKEDSAVLVFCQPVTL